MSTGERVYRLLLRAYPAEFRAAFGREMTQLFRDRRREEGGARFWGGIALDVVRSAPAQRWESWRGRRGGTVHTGEGKMITMAILAIMVGALEGTGALFEGWRAFQDGDGPNLLGGTMGLVASALLLSAGVALLRRSPGAVGLARGAALTMLPVTVLIGFVLPMMGGLAILLGIGFPLALLLFLRRRGEDGTPATA
jgi:hypothetical protein